MTARSCQTCEFFTALHNQCRIGPPRAFILPGPDGQPQVTGIYPPTGPDGWCGAYTPEGESPVAIVRPGSRVTN
jgi:hypothetical protein